MIAAGSSDWFSFLHPSFIFLVSLLVFYTLFSLIFALLIFLAVFTYFYTIIFVSVAGGIAVRIRQS
jgi:hypothetical protein